MSDWIEWKGRENPVPGAIVDLRYGRGDEYFGRDADMSNWKPTGHHDGASDIIAYRVVSTTPASAANSEDGVTIDRRTAEIINGAFLPLNPNKMRSAAPETVAAAHAFKAALAALQPQPQPQPTQQGGTEEAVSEDDLLAIGKLVGMYCGNTEFDAWKRILAALKTEKA